jgi:hypothetical protein
MNDNSFQDDFTRVIAGSRPHEQASGFVLRVHVRDVTLALLSRFRANSSIALAPLETARSRPMCCYIYALLAVVTDFDVPSQR